VDSPPKDRKQIIIIIIRILRYWIISNLTERALLIQKVITLKEIRPMATRVSSEADYLTIQTSLATHLLKWKEVQEITAKNKINSNSKIFIWIWIRVLDLPTTPTTCPNWPWVPWRAQVAESIYQIIKMLKFKIHKIKCFKFNKLQDRAKILQLLEWLAEALFLIMFLASNRIKAVQMELKASTWRGLVVLKECRIKTRMFQIKTLSIVKTTVL